MHAVMAIYNAWCRPGADADPRRPRARIDAARRRPWIDWIHTSRDQAALVRPFVKWDDQPASVPAGNEALLRGWLMITHRRRRRRSTSASTSTLQSAAAAQPAASAAGRAPALPRRVRRRQRLPTSTCAQRILRRQRPLVLIGRHRRDEDSWRRRLALIESLGAAVICDQKSGVGFPTHAPALRRRSRAVFRCRAA